MAKKKIITSTARTAPRYFVNIGTVYWLKEYLADSGLPITRLKRANIRPPSTIQISVYHKGDSAPVYDAFKISRRFSAGSNNTRSPLHRGTNQELEIALDTFLSKFALGPDASAGDPLGTFILELTPPDNALSQEAAGPKTGDDDPARPGNCGANDQSHDGLFRPVKLQFDLQVGEDNSFLISNLGDAGQVALQRGPHWTAFMHPDPLSTGAHQRIMLDWKPDWIRQVLGRRKKTDGSMSGKQEERRPKLNPRRGNVEMVELHNISGARPLPEIGRAINGFLAVQVTNKKGKVVDQESGIHYIVDVDGHITKMAHESFWVQHGGGKGSPKGWGHIRHGINESAVGIEHALFEKAPVFYPALIDASVDLVRQLVSHFGTIPPWNIVGHAHVLSRQKHGCPGVDFPWIKYEEEVLGEVGYPPRSVPLALGADETYEPDLKVIYNGYFDDLPGGVLKIGNSTDRAAIAELQEDLRTIGFVFHQNVNGIFDEGTEISVKEFHSRFMNESHPVTKKLSRGSLKEVDRASAIQIKRVLRMLEFVQSTDFPFV